MLVSSSPFADASRVATMPVHGGALGVVGQDVPLRGGHRASEPALAEAPAGSVAGARAALLEHAFDVPGPHLTTFRAVRDRIVGLDEPGRARLGRLFGAMRERRLRSILPFAPRFVPSRSSTTTTSNGSRACSDNYHATRRDRCRDTRTLTAGGTGTDR
jgi:hypothetical protein